MRRQRTTEPVIRHASVQDKGLSLCFFFWLVVNYFFFLTFDKNFDSRCHTRKPLLFLPEYLLINFPDDRYSSRAEQEDSVQHTNTKKRYDRVLSVKTGEKVNLPDIWAEKRVVLCFLRHLGCRFCHQQIAAERILLELKRSESRWWRFPWHPRFKKQENLSKQNSRVNSMWIQQARLMRILRQRRRSANSNLQDVKCNGVSSSRQRKGKTSSEEATKIFKVKYILKSEVNMAW